MRYSDQEWKAIEEDNRERARMIVTRVLAWSEIRKIILARDNNTCQMCGKHATSSLHIHHILKRRQGGTDCIDNLITLCHTCHASADNQFYAIDWNENPPEIAGMIRSSTSAREIFQEYLEIEWQDEVERQNSEPYANWV